MTYRGYFELNGIELSNNSRTVAHLGVDTPMSDLELFGAVGDECGLIESVDHPGFFELPAASTLVSDGLATIPPGGRRWSPGLLLVDGSCWGPAAFCGTCSSMVDYDDTWPGLKDFLGHHFYRPELAPWYTVELPESAEFGGMWVTRVDGLGSTPVERPITQVVGPGAVAGPHRDKPRTLTFEALLVACTHAGAEYGRNWLSCLLRATTDRTDSTLRYLAASPSHSGVNPDSLVREVHGVVLTREVQIAEAFNTSAKAHAQANLYRVTWEMTVLSPYAWLPPVVFEVDWDEITRQPINWVHAADCGRPASCEDMPVLFSSECVPEEIDRLVVPPPVCGGCLPVGGIDKYVFRVPTMDYPFRCRDTAVTLAIRNHGEYPLTLQGFWRECGADVRCEDNWWPLQVSGLAPGAELVLDGISGRFWANYDGRRHRPVGVVGTPTGAPWRPPSIDRQQCWDFIVQAAEYADFTVTMTLTDREP